MCLASGMLEEYRSDFVLEYYQVKIDYFSLTTSNLCNKARSN